MPVLENADYQAPLWLFNGHLQTIYPSLFRKVDGISYNRVRISTPDNDFLDIDMRASKKGERSTSLVILSHGLEGSSGGQYIKGMVSLLNKEGFDCWAWNFRGCSGEPNKQLRFYHSGATDDLGLVVDKAKALYKNIYLIGFSLGGNLTLKYLGEQAENLCPEIKKAVTFSVPLHLAGSSNRLARWDDWVYTKRFNRNLAKKVRAKAPFFPKELDITKLDKIKTLRDFDEYYTSQLHGFNDALDYYTKSSSIHFIDKIAVPTLIINAKNDPFLSKECFPFEQAAKLEKVFFEAPATGGHCGFFPVKYEGVLWSEQRALAWLRL